MADPFVLQWQGLYYAYGTGIRGYTADGRMFQILQSPDLVHWTALGGALDVLADSYCNAYWAPEVAARNGRFYLYFSAADPSGDESHRLHVAVADHPAGPFRDAVRLLSDEDFTIDAHPFHDPADGRWYLFFSKDFFDSRVGTAVAAVPLADDMVSTVGAAVTVLRPSNDWQVYERNRSLYGRTWDAWHTVEGPTVTTHDGRYYLLYSGGNWQTEGYGVGYAVADSVLGPYHEPDAGPVVLQGDGKRVIGPGHNCLAIGPDGAAQFVVYHAWDSDRTARRMCIDPLIWTESGPRCLGPTTSPQQLDLSRPLQTAPAEISRRIT